MNPTIIKLLTAVTSAAIYVTGHLIPDVAHVLEPLAGVVAGLLLPQVGGAKRALPVLALAVVLPTALLSEGCAPSNELSAAGYTLEHAKGALLAICGQEGSEQLCADGEVVYDAAVTAYDAAYQCREATHDLVEAADRVRTVLGDDPGD